MSKTLFNKVDDKGNILPNINVITSYGAKDENAKILQKLLNRNGYKLDVNGTFDDLTLSAFNDFQKKNGLTVSNYVGQDAWNMLSGDTQKVYTTTPATNPNTTGATRPSSTSTSGGYKSSYTESPAVSEAYKLLQQHLGTAPSYSSNYKDQLSAQLEAILGRKDFKYDLNGDALYQQYKDMYTNQAKMGMADTMGQAAAMTGGYGNSYAQSVGQQMYQKQMQGLNDIIPELYQMALDKYNMEGQTMLDEYSLLADAENQEYSKYMDEYNKWLTEKNYLTDKYYSERDFDYAKYADDKSYAYAQERDRVADEQWATELLLGGGATKGATNDGIDYSDWSITDWRDYFKAIIDEEQGGPEAAYYDFEDMKDFIPDSYIASLDAWFKRLLGHAESE